MRNFPKWDICREYINKIDEIKSSPGIVETSSPKQFYLEVNLFKQ